MNLTRQEFIEQYEGKNLGEIFDHLRKNGFSFRENKKRYSSPKQPNLTNLETPETLLSFLKGALPALRQSKPLAIGINSEIVELFPILKDYMLLLNDALKLHVNSKRYLVNIQYGTKRLHLDQSVSGLISSREQAWACKKKHELYPSEPSPNYNSLYILNDVDGDEVRIAVVCASSLKRAYSFVKWNKTGFLTTLDPNDLPTEDIPYVIEDTFPNKTVMIDKISKLSIKTREGLVSFKRSKNGLLRVGLTDDLILQWCKRYGYPC